MKLKDYIVAKGDFNSDRELKNVDALVFMLSNILYNKKGFLPTNTKLGLGILLNRHFLETDKTNINQINNDLQEQVKLAFPDIDMNVSYTVKRDSDNIPYGNLVITGEGITIDVTTTKVNDVKYNVVYKDYTK